MVKHLFFAGIAGHAMRGLALAARSRGFVVSGLDEHAVPPGSDWLDGQGLEWYRTYKPALLVGVHRVVLSGGTAEDHPLIGDAQRLGIEIISFAQLVGELTEGRRVLAIGGTHGKTTTSSLLTWLFESAGRRPDYLIGIQPLNFESSARFEGSDVVVLEGDEYKVSSLEDRSKLEYYHPDVLALTSVEHDHPDVFKTETEVVRRFERIVGAMPKDGLLLAEASAGNLDTVAGGAPCRVVRYGEHRGESHAQAVSFSQDGLRLDIQTPYGEAPDLHVGLYVRHNVANAVAAVSIALAEGLSARDIRRGMATFRGAYRRFNLLTKPSSPVTVIDDYAHHPTEVATTIDAVRLHFPHRRIVAVFRPHTYSRTEALLSEYQRSFDEADLVFIAPIEASREALSEATVSGEDIVRGIGRKARYLDDRAQAEEVIAGELRAGDVVLCMTVSGYEKLAESLAAKARRVDRKSENPATLAGNGARG